MPALTLAENFSWWNQLKNGEAIPRIQHHLQGVRNVRVWSFIAAIALSVITVQSTVLAQNAGGQPKVTVAVVDIGHVLKNHPTMKGEMERIQADMKSADDQMGQRRDAILKQMEQLRSMYTEGTPEYEAQEKKIAEQDTEFRLSLIKEKKRFEEMQAQVVYQVYTDITNQVQAAANAWGTQVVLRVNREKMDPKKPETVQLVMSQDVIYYNPSIDLTDWVLQQLTALAQQRGGAVNR